MAPGNKGKTLRDTRKLFACAANYIICVWLDGKVKNPHIEQRKQSPRRNLLQFTYVHLCIDVIDLDYWRKTNYDEKTKRCGDALLFNPLE